jgi:hypothetical protein
MFDLNNTDIDTYEKTFKAHMFTEYIKTFGDIYEFGVYGGATLQCILEQLEQNDIKYNRVFAFDSFCGLPVECEYSGHHFMEGNYNAKKLFNNEDTEQIKQHILKKTHFIPILIEGFFKNVLTSELITTYSIKPASFIHIDCDLYSSTKTVLEWIFSNKLYQIGTIIRYDDWFPNVVSGEEKAHNEICEKYNIKNKSIYRISEANVIEIIE